MQLWIGEVCLPVRKLSYINLVAHPVSCELKSNFSRVGLSPFPLPFIVKPSVTGSFFYDHFSFLRILSCVEMGENQGFLHPCSLARVAPFDLFCYILVLLKKTWEEIVAAF